MADALCELTTTDFDEAVSDRSAIVEFWAPWCGPCRQLAPELESLAAAHPELLVAKVNIDEEPALAHRFGVMSIPTTLHLVRGVVLAHVVGAMAAGRLAVALNLD